MRSNLTALNRVRRHFPQVNTVSDAKKSIQVCVKKEDSKSGRKKDPQNCALARACTRSKIADGAIIGISFSYLVKGTHATRYKTSETVGREITSFDRHQDFAAGANYTLSKVGPSASLNRQPKKHYDNPKPYKANTSGKEVIHSHRTSRIRVVGK